MKLKQNFVIVTLCSLLLSVSSLKAQDDDPILGDVIALSPCTTIDLDADSRHFSNCAQDALSQSKIKPKPDSPSNASNNLDQAFDNLGSCTKSDTAMIIGHGQSGEVRVGGGDYAIADNIRDTMHIADIPESQTGKPWNPSKWEGLASSKAIKGKFKTIILLGCETGSGTSGSVLVSAFSSAAQSQVKAPTSKVWCDDDNHLRLEKGAGWTEAKNGSVKIGSASSINTELSLTERSDAIKIPINELRTYNTYFPKSISAVSRCVFKTPYHSFQPCRPITKHTELLGSILFDKPLQPHAIPNAEVTGTISLTVCPDDSRADKCEIHDFDVLNDNLVADNKTRTYYYVTDSFKANWINFE